MAEGSVHHPDIDGGWAWVIVFACAMHNFLLGGTMKTYGLLYAEFIELFPEGPAEVGIIGLVFGVTALLFAPVGGRLSDVLSIRKMGLVSGVVIGTSIACTSLAPNLAAAVATFGIITGGAIGMIDGPILSSIGRYFKEKRNMASGLAWVGSSVGNLTLAPLFSFLISEYGIRGAVLILGGLWFHVCVVASLLRPTPGDSTTKGSISKMSALASHETKGETAEFGLKHNNVTRDSNLDRTGEKTEVYESLEKEDNLETLPVVQSLGDENVLNSCEHEIGECAAPHCKQDVSQSDLKQNTRYVDFLKNGPMWLVIIVIGCGFYGYYVPIICMPVYANENGMSRFRAALIVSTFGGVEIISRVSIGSIMDILKIKPRIMLPISFVIVGLSGQMVVFYPAFWSLIVYAVVHGLLGGVVHVLMVSLIFEVVRTEWFGSAMGLAVMQLNIMSAISSTTAGLMKELTGSYAHVFRLSAGMYLLGAAIHVCGPRVCRFPGRPDCDSLHKQTEITAT